MRITMLLELHAHTNRHSKCSLIDPVTLVKKAIAKGLQGLVITEHHYQWSDEELAKLKIEAGAVKAFILLSGQEVSTDAGHVLVYGADTSIPEKTNLKDLRKLYPRAALVLAHPYRKKSSVAEETLTTPLLDAVEIFSLNHTPKENYAGLKSWHELKFTAISGSDTHSEEKAGALPSQFDHEVKNIRDLVTEIKNGRVRPFFKEIPKSGSDLTVTEITLGTKGDDEVRQRIIIKTLRTEKRWEKTRTSALLMQKIHGGGFDSGRYRVPRVIELNETEKTVIEEGQRGKNLFELLCGVSPSAGLTYFELSARWMSRFHGLKFKPGLTTGFIEREERKLAAYENTFTTTNNPRLKQAKLLLDFVRAEESALTAKHSASFILNHGDFHPKNIIIGQDRMHDPETVFVSVIDFANALETLPAFDVGYYLAQFKSQFAAYPEILKRYTDELFIKTYFGTAKPPKSFRNEVDLFIIRANLSIANYFMKVGKGESRELYSLVAGSTALMKKLKSRR